MSVRPVLILEGSGDEQSVPGLIRNVLYEHDVFDVAVQPKPIKNQNILKLRRDGELERFISYALSREGDSVLVMLDTDKLCAKEIALEFSRRARKIGAHKRIGFSFFTCEYEVFFLYCLNIIADRYPEYGWDLESWNSNRDFEQVRGAKAMLSKLMKGGKAYKETRDQAKFTSALDFAHLRQNSRSFAHFESTLLWLSRNHQSNGLIYPIS